MSRNLSGLAEVWFGRVGCGALPGAQNPEER